MIKILCNGNLICFYKSRQIKSSNQNMVAKEAFNWFKMFNHHGTFYILMPRRKIYCLLLKWLGFIKEKKIKLILHVHQFLQIKASCFLWVDIHCPIQQKIILCKTTKDYIMHEHDKRRMEKASQKSNLFMQKNLTIFKDFI